MPFRLASKKILLTYAQAPNLTKEQILTHIQTHGNVKHYVIGKELHADGGQHFHCFVEFERKLDTTNNRAFDIGQNHPNIKRVGRHLSDSDNCWEYCTKHDNGYLSDTQTSPYKPDSSSWADTIDTAKDANSFLQLALQRHPRDAALNLERLQYFASWHYAERRESWVHPFPEHRYTLTPEMEQWVNTELQNRDRPKTLLLIGPTRTGKTIWARSLTPNHTYWNGMIDITTLTKQTELLIMDDFDWKYVPSKKQFWGAQKQFVITDKYRKKRDIIWGKPLIYICNDDQNPFYLMPRCEEDWYKQNCITAFIVNKLYG
ncbi:MAG: replication associated protein [Wigfec virus K19_493]|nr:MAG: replication associated protein [Wigfec virus K19_493]